MVSGEGIGRQPTRLPRPWDSPGKNTGVGCHFLLWCMKVKSQSEVAQLCPTPSDPMDCSLPGFSVHGIFPDKSTGVGCHCLLQCMKVKSQGEVTQLCTILSDLMDCSLPGSSVHGIFQARVLEWGAIAFSNSSWVISNPKRWCCESAPLNMPANLENSVVATGLEKVSFHFQS